MNYNLIEWCNEAIKNWPKWISTGKDLFNHRYYEQKYVESLGLAKKHYENGGSIENRPCI